MNSPGGRGASIIPLPLAILAVLVVVAAVSLLSSGLPVIQPRATVTPTATATLPPTPSATLQPTLTETPRPTWTLVPSLTPTASATPTTTPTLTPTPAWCGRSGLMRTPAALPAPGGTLRVVYLNGGDLWLWEEGQPSRRLTTVEDITAVELSTDGQMAAYLRPGLPYGSDIWLLDLTIGEASLLAGQERLLPLAAGEGVLGVTPHHLSWVPGRRRLAFNARPVYTEIRDYIPDDLWLLEIPSLQIHNLLPDGQGGEFTFSPDGLNVAVARPERLDLYGASGESPRRDTLPGYHGVGLGTEDYYPRPFWAPDSRSLRLGLPAPVTAINPNPEVDLVELPVQGVRPVKLGTIRALPPTVIFSPDLSRAAYLNWPDLTPHIKELGLADTSGPAFSSAIYTVGQDLEFLGWSADSQHFAFWMPASLSLRLGSLCSPAGDLISGQAGGALKWVDAEHFLYLAGPTRPWTLNLGSIGGAVEEISPVEGVIDFEFAFLR